MTHVNLLAILSMTIVMMNPTLKFVITIMEHVACLRSKMITAQIVFVILMEQDILQFKLTMDVLYQHIKEMDIVMTKIT